MSDMKKLLLLLIIPFFFACDLGSNEFSSFTGLWSTTDTTPEDTAIITRTPLTGDLVVRIMVVASSGGTTITEIPPCTIDISDPTDISEAYTYNLDGINIVVTFEDYENATVKASWDYLTGGVNASGSKEYRLKHRYSSFRYRDNDDLILDYFGI